MRIAEAGRIVQGLEGWRRELSIARRLVTAMASPDRPLMCFLTVTRRCNLRCGYCLEYDDVSPPVPLETLLERIDRLAALRTGMVVLNGGEPLLHPQVAQVVAAIRDRGMVPSINTNGFLLTKEHILAFNEAGLYAMQLSIDSVRPNAVTQKSLKTLLPRLQLLKDHARFRVRANTVLGAAPPEEALEVARVVLAHGFGAKTALGRNADGSPMSFDPSTRRSSAAIGKLPGRNLGLLGEGYQDRLLRDGRVDWKCRAGARFFHVCEHGLVHLCGPRFGAPAIPLADYGLEEIRRAFAERKACASGCAVAYAHQVSRIDRLRPQRHRSAAEPLAV